MASDRIGTTSAKLIAVPPFEIVTVSTDFMLEQPQIKSNIKRVPVNQPLVDSILKENMLNPFLCMKEWYPLAGSQRIRAVLHIKDNIEETYNTNIVVHRFLEDYHNIFYLWGDEEFRSKAIAIWFQLQELVFKSLYYNHDADGSGIKMTKFEDLGEELEWQHDEYRSGVDSNANSDTDRSAS
tara:strand:+ start:3427 stop:3972 length:546 start_codon:yes stop_codon:yes gene_type:complete